MRTLGDRPGQFSFEPLRSLNFEEIAYLIQALGFQSMIVGTRHPLRIDELQELPFGKAAHLARHMD